MATAPGTSTTPRTPAWRSAAGATFTSTISSPGSFTSPAVTSSTHLANRLLRSRSPFRSASRSGSGSRRPRVNPFEMHLCTEKLSQPFFSPSVFSTVQSPSQETSNASGRFWSVEQQAHLFPAEISDDSPWKQETAMSVLDQETENRTQEAIDHYFSIHHRVHSPEDGPRAWQSMAMDTGSPDLPLTRRSSARASTESPGLHKVSQWAQTELSLPPTLPEEVETVLAKYFTFTERQDQQPKSREPSPGYNEQQMNNLSNSTLRRKLFENMADDSTSSSSSEREADCRAQASYPLLDPHPHLMSSPIKASFLSPEITITPISKLKVPFRKERSWSSSPRSKGRARTSMSPPAHVTSPTFSPIDPRPRHYATGQNKENVLKAHNS